MSGQKFVVARVEEIPEGERKMVKAGERELAVFHVDGQFFALLNRCPHQGGPLCFGELTRPVTSEAPGQYSVDTERHLLACPWHGWEFDLHTGRSFFDPARFKARPFPVEIERGEEIHQRLAEAEDRGAQADGPVEGPYTAPILPVEIEDDYIVVTVPSRRRV